MSKLTIQDEDLTVVKINDYSYPLLWFDSLGFGYLKSDGYDYGQEYWNKYIGYHNEFGQRLTDARIDFVKRNVEVQSDLQSDFICDVGIGCGQFVETLNCKGFDVNPFANEWLKDRGSYTDPYRVAFKVMCFWDVLEHMNDPDEILLTDLGVKKHIFISIPIYADLEACLKSKHLRPGEHIWHFTHDGLIKFMAAKGFEIRDVDNFETKLGREDILSYYFVEI